jgi:hypothetical protein
LRAVWFCETFSAIEIVFGVAAAMSGVEGAHNFDRYRKLLAEADDESKRLAFINLLIEEKAKDRLAGQSLRNAPSGASKPR